MSILRMPPLIPSSLVITTETSLCHKLSHLSIQPITHFHPKPSTIIRMGGGPRTFPGGVSKWQWKRMQSKKQKQLLKARLCRERQIYEMRKRAELRAAVSELERPWEVVERAPTLFSVSADEQLKVLADRFHKPGGYDLWSDRDGPQLFQNQNGLPSARFFPKGAVHSLKPYGIGKNQDLEDGGEREVGDYRRRSRKRGTYRRDSDNAGFDSGAYSNTSDNVDVEGGLNKLRISSGREEMGVKSRSMVRSREGDGRGGREEMGVKSRSMVRYREGDGRGSSRGGLRNKGDRQNGESGSSYKANTKQLSQDTERGHRGSFAQRGRNGGSVQDTERGHRGSFAQRGRNGGSVQDTERGHRGSFAQRGRNGVSVQDTERGHRGSFAQRGRNGGSVRRYNSGRVQRKPEVSSSREVFDMSLKQDGSYELQTSLHKNMFSGGFEDEFELD